MDLIKQYIIQCIVSAANNLRLSTEKIEVVALIREEITNCAEMESLINEMKKSTELSTFGIKLGEILNYLAKGKIDFLKLSDKFKEHSSVIVRELNTLLEKISPQSYRQISGNILQNLESVKSKDINIEVIEDRKGLIVEEIKELKEVTSVKSETIIKEELVQDSDEKLKEEYLLDVDENSDELMFEKFEERILNPIKSIDKFLREIRPDRIDENELDKYYKLMEKNSEISNKIGFEIIGNMHSIFAKALLLIKSKSILPIKEVIEGMRACLIVIVAVVRGKEVDITNYLNRAENFGKQIQNLI
jgi:hypothetical protein